MYDKKIRYMHDYYGHRRKPLSAEEIMKREKAAKQRAIKDRAELAKSFKRAAPIERAVKRANRILDIEVTFRTASQGSRVYARLIVENKREYAFIIDAGDRGAYAIYDNGNIRDYNRRSRSDRRYQPFEGGHDSLSECLASLAMILIKHYPHRAKLIHQAIFHGFESVCTKPQKAKITFGCG